jgi:hypothetical protein
LREVEIFDRFFSEIKADLDDAGVVPGVVRAGENDGENRESIGQRSGEI